MPYYRPIKDIEPKKDRHRLLASLDRLRGQLESKMPEKTRASRLILGTWNIRNFDDDRFRHGPRTSEDYHLIAEVISRFDVIAVQEVCDDLGPLRKVMWLLGHDYDFIVTDITEGKPGNVERLGFIFDSSKVKFKGVAGELVLPDKMQIIHMEKKRQFSRTPFMCSFQAGWFKFKFSTVHIYFGKSSGEAYKTRVREIAQVAKFLAKRAKDDDDNHVLVGDFNIKRSGSLGDSALKKHGFEIFENRKGSNKDQTKFFDQISFRVRKGELRLSKGDKPHGVLQFFDSVFREEDFVSYRADLKRTVTARIGRIKQEIKELNAKIASSKSAKAIAGHKKKKDKRTKTLNEWKSHLTSDAKLKKYYLGEWRTFHMSDHLPLWVELEIDFSEEYLAYLKTL